jgi:hypothetical protein
MSVNVKDSLELIALVASTLEDEKNPLRSVPIVKIKIEDTVDRIVKIKIEDTVDRMDLVKSEEKKE